MRAGRLDRRITIEQPTTSADSFGEPDTTWSNFATNVAAEVFPSRRTENFEGQQVFAENELVFRIRYRTGITSDMRIDYGGTKYDIQGPPVEPRGTRGQELHIIAKARAVT